MMTYMCNFFSARHHFFHSQGEYLETLKFLLEVLLIARDIPHHLLLTPILFSTTVTYFIVGDQ